MLFSLLTTLLNIYFILVEFYYYTHADAAIWLAELLIHYCGRFSEVFEPLISLKRKVQ